MNREESNRLIWRIAERAEKMRLLRSDIASLIMDLKYAYEEFDLKLEELLDAEDFYFACEVMSIQRNVDSENRAFEEGFVPMFVGR